MPRLATIALAFGLMLAGSARADFLVLTVSSYSGGPYVNIYGTHSFFLPGVPTRFVNLEEGKPTFEFMDNYATLEKLATPASNDPTVEFTGTIETVVTLSDVSGPTPLSASATFYIPFTLTTSPGTGNQVTHGYVAPQTITIGVRSITIDPNSPSGNIRGGIFTLRAAAAVPEPGSLVLAGIPTALGLLSICRRPRVGRAA